MELKLTGKAAMGSSVDFGEGDASSSLLFLLSVLRHRVATFLSSFIIVTEGTCLMLVFSGTVYLSLEHLGLGDSCRPTPI